MKNNHYWGIDLGGTKVECVVMDTEYRPLFRKRLATERTKGYQHILQRIKQLIDQAADELNYYPDVIGFGTPGTSDPYTGNMKNCNSTELNGMPLKADLAKLLQVKVVMSNDANCFALSESKMGIVAETFPQAEVVFAVIMGTGCGAGITVHGKVLNGLHNIAGEWGHNVLVPDGDACYCGKRGCVETVIAGPSVERYYQRLTGQSRPLVDIIELARQTDSTLLESETEAAHQTLTHLLDSFAQAIAQIINVLDPDVVVIGGGVGNIDELYSQTSQRILPWLFNDRLETKFVKPMLGDSSGVFGAALLCE